MTVTLCSIFNVMLLPYVNYIIFYYIIEMWFALTMILMLQPLVHESAARRLRAVLHELALGWHPRKVPSQTSSPPCQSETWEL